MTEEEEIPEHAKCKCKIVFVDGYPCILLPPGAIMRKPPPRMDVIPFRFTTIQEVKEKKSMNDIIEELKKLFEDDFGFTHFRILQPPLKEDKKNDNTKRGRETEEESSSDA
jgi:hypothetical protein